MAAELRLEGNAQYKAGNYAQAIDLYTQAAELAPEDPAPLGNISAALWELGRYEATISKCDRALELQSEPDKRQKLLLRKTKSQCLTHRYEEAQITLHLLDDGQEKEALATSCLCRIGSRASIHDLSLFHAKLIDDIPRYKPAIREIKEYFYLGQDVPTALLDSQVLGSDRPLISLMFGGIGDGRHLCKTISELSRLERQNQSPVRKRLHCTVVDINPAIIARLFIILLILSDISTTQGGHEKERLHLCLYYTYLVPLMPAELHIILSRKLEQAIGIIDRVIPTPAWFQILDSDRASVRRVLEQWQTEIPAKFTTLNVRRGVLAEFQTASQVNTLRRMQLRVSRASAQYRKENWIYDQSAILLARVNNTIYPAEANVAFQSFDAGNPSHVDSGFLRHVGATWKTNPVLFDLDSGTRMGDLVNNPFAFGHELGVTGMPGGLGGDNGLYGCVRAFFDDTATSFARLQGRLEVQAYVGDVNHVLEKMRFLDLGQQRRVDRPSQSAARNPSIADASTLRTEHDGMISGSERTLFLCDRIHLSNIPDYVGGSLTTFTYATPLVYASTHSYVTSNCQRNPGEFANAGDYNTEYVALATPRKVEDVFAVRYAVNPPPHAAMMPMMMPMMMRYIQWQRISKSAGSDRIMKWATFATWLHRMFFKLAIPKDRLSQSDPSYIFPSLNLTAFVRLCAQLAVNGYPAHWLNQVLDAICSGEVMTRARPPRSVPLERSELAQDFSVRKQSTSPFIAELTTLLALWQHILPFGLLGTSVPALDTVHKYEVEMLNTGHPRFSDAPQYVLVFLHEDHMPPVDWGTPARPAASESLRSYLLSDETRKKTKKAKLLRQHLHVISTCSIRSDGHPRYTASFWMRNDVIENLKAQGGWIVTIWRSDDWIVESKPKQMNAVKDLGPFWKE